MRYGNTRLISKTPAVTAAAYSAGNVLGGAQALGPISTPTYRGVLKNVTVVDRGNQKPAITILLIKGAPAGTYTDKAAPSNVSSDAANILGKVEIAQADYTTIGGVAVATVDVSRVIACDDAKQVTAVPVVSGTPTPVSVGDYTFTYGVLAD